MNIADEVREGNFRGRIAEVNRVRGYALIAGDDGRQYFFHCSELKGGMPWRRAIRKNRIAEFEVVDNSEARTSDPRRRDRAVNVVVLL